MTRTFEGETNDRRLNALTDKCYVVSELLYHALGGKEAGWKPMQMQHEGASHWFLRHADGTILDATVTQFETVPDYTVARGKGFLTKSASARTRALAERVI